MVTPTAATDPLLVARKLKVRADRNGEAHARLQRHDFFTLTLLAPHFASARYDKPDFFDRSMSDGERSSSSLQLEMRHAARSQREQDSNVRAIGAQRP